MDLNHGIDKLENLKLDAEVSMEDANLHDCCRGYTCLIANRVRSLDVLRVSIRIKDVDALGILSRHYWKGFAQHMDLNVRSFI